jgi:hypothetical protein
MVELVKKSEHDAEEAILATITLAEQELIKLAHGQSANGAESLTEESILVFRKGLIAIQLVRLNRNNFTLNRVFCLFLQYDSPVIDLSSCFYNPLVCKADGWSRNIGT